QRIKPRSFTFPAGSVGRKVFRPVYDVVIALKPCMGTESSAGIERVEICCTVNIGEPISGEIGAVLGFLSFAVGREPFLLLLRRGEVDKRSQRQSTRKDGPRHSGSSSTRSPAAPA